MDTKLLEKFNRTVDEKDKSFEYLREWLEANDLLDSKNFVCWILQKGNVKPKQNDKGETIYEEEKPNKIPINAHTGGKAMSNNPSTWDTFNTCLKYKHDHKDIKGVALMFGVTTHGRGLVGIDLDHITNWDMTNDILDRLKGYKEISQSGTGIHVITFGNLPSGARKKDEIEMYSKGRFFALTGVRIHQENYVEECGELNQDKIIADIHERYMGKAETVPVYSVLNTKKVIRSIGDTKIISIMYGSKGGQKIADLYNGYWGKYHKSQSEADIDLCGALAFFTQKDIRQMDRMFRASGLMRDKWDRVQSGSTYGEITMSKAISSCNFVYDPNYATKSDGEITIRKNINEEKKPESDFDLNDTGNAMRFAVECEGELKFNYTRDRWMFWNGVVWEQEMKGSPQTKRKFNRFATKVKKEIFKEEDEDLKKIKLRNVDRMFSCNGKKAILEETKCVLDISTNDSKFDLQCDLLNTSTAVLDLKTGKSFPHKKDYMFTQVTATFADKTKCPKWEKFLKETFYRDDIPFIKKALGQTLYGNNKAEKFILLVGNGGDGKTVFLNVVSEILGEYAHSIDMTGLSETKFDKDASRIFAQEQKTRMLIGNEMKTGKKIDSSLIKSIIGGGKIKGRYLYAEAYEFKALFTLWMSANVKPIVNDESNGFWRRCAIVRCPFSKEEKDMNHNLEKELISEEGPAILNYMLDGALEFAKDERLELTKNMKNELKDYREEMSVIQRFIGEKADEVIDASELASTLYTTFADWFRKTNHAEPMSKTAFGKQMSARYSKKRTSMGVRYDGIMLRYQG